MKDKIRAIWCILISDSYALITAKSKAINTMAWSDKELNLEREMLVATTLIKLYDTLVKDIEKKAVDAGEASTFQALYNVISELQGPKR